MVHRTLHFGVGDGYIIRIFGERTIRHCTRINSSPRGRVRGRIDGCMFGEVSKYSPVSALPGIWGMRKNITVRHVCRRAYKKLYLLDEGRSLEVSPSAFLFEDPPCVGVPFLRDDPDAAWRDERRPFEARDSAVGEARWENSLGGDAPWALTWEDGRRPG